MFIKFNLTRSYNIKNEREMEKEEDEKETKEAQEDERKVSHNDFITVLAL